MSNMQTAGKKNRSTGPFSCDARDSQKDIFEGKPPKNLNFK